MNAKLILAGSVAALVPVVAVPTALSLSGSSSTKESPELSVSERPSVPPYPPHPPLEELRNTLMLPTLDNFPLPPESLQDTSDDSYPTAESEAKRLALKEKLQNIAKPVKTKLSGFVSSFPYDQIDSNKGNRKEQFNKFVEQTDKLRTESIQEIKDLLSKDEFKDKDFPSIFREYLGLDLISAGEDLGYSSFINLSIIRKAEVEAQKDKDKSQVITKTKVTGRITPEDISDFCNTPSAENSHLGIYSSSRKSEEENKEYMFFTYYSYCSKNSYYLKSYFDSDILPSTQDYLIKDSQQSI